MKVRVIAVITDLDIIQKIFSHARLLGRNNCRVFCEIIGDVFCSLLLQFAFASRNLRSLSYLR